MSSDSSDDENLDLIREACDPEFKKSSLYEKPTEKDIAERKIQDKTEQLPSLRPKKDDSEQFNLLDVTPTFQNYVARQLSEILEKKLKKSLVDSVEGKPKKKRKKSGVKLLADSAEYLDVNLSEEPINKIRKKIKKRCIEEEIPDDVKVRDAAVNCEDILSRKEVRNWAKINKGEVFEYKKDKSGVLVCVEKVFK